MERINIFRIVATLPMTLSIFLFQISILDNVFSVFSPGNGKIINGSMVHICNFFREVTTAVFFILKLIRQKIYRIIKMSMCYRRYFA